MRKIRNKKGFTLAETLLALTITLMVAGLLAGGIPLALNAYHKVVDSANAKTVLATLTTELRDELALAKNMPITSNGEKLTYTNTMGKETELFKVDSTTFKDNGIYLKVKKSDSEYKTVLLLSNASMAGNLCVRYSTVDFDGKVITFHNLEVYSESLAKLATLNEYRIRVLSNE